MRYHIELEAHALTAAGIPGEEAERRALATFGGVTRYTEEARDAWPLRWADYVVVDVRLAFRSLRRTPSFTAGAVIALALGMAVNTLVFSAVDSIAFRPLAVRHPEQLVALYGAQGEATLLGFSYPAFEDFRRGAGEFSGLAAVTEGPVSLTGNGDPVVAWAGHVSDGYFTMLGVQPALGRVIAPGDLNAPIAMLSHTLWETRFARNPGVIGQAIQINGTALTIVGVAPAQFTGTRLFTYEPSVWLPVGLHRQTIPGSGTLLTDRDASRFLLIGRMRDGVGIREASATVDAVARRLAEMDPERYRALRVQLLSNRTPINPWLAPPNRIEWIGRLLLVGTSLVLLIACANVASLLLARMTARHDEIAIRLSLGSSRRRLVQQLLTEGLVLAAMGALVAIPLAIAGSRGVLGLSPHVDYASWWRPPDAARVGLFSILLTVVAPLLFGLAPALQAIRRNTGASNMRPAAPAGRLRLRDVLLVGQVALSMTVLVTAGLFVRSLRHSKALNTGFIADGAVAFTLDPQLSPSYDTTRTRLVYARVLTRLAEIPGVSSIGRASSVPLDGNGAARRIYTDEDPPGFDRAPAAEFSLSAPGYFSAIGTPIIAGRDFQPHDSAGTRDVAIVNDVLARRLWPRESPLGKTIHIDSPTNAPVEVVGVARSSNYRLLGEAPRSAFWRDLDRTPRSRTTIVVRARRVDPALIREVRAAVQEIDPALPLIGLGSLHDHVSLAYSAVESGAVGAATFALLAVLLTTSGIFGAVSYGVSQRRREIGIRIALGARRSTVVRLVASKAVALTAVGIGVGLAVPLLVPMGMDRLLYGVTPRDPLTLVLAAVLFCAVSIAASAIPAGRAARLDPMRVLRLLALAFLLVSPIAAARDHSALKVFSFSMKGGFAIGRYCGRTAMRPISTKAPRTPAGRTTCTVVRAG